MFDRPTWIEINLANYAYHFRQIRKLVGPDVRIMAVVKANGYGHGIVLIARTAVKEGASYLGVINIYEARQIRDAGISTPILLLNYTHPDGVKEALDLNLTLNVMHDDVLTRVDKEARKRNIRAKIHVKIDSGMHRLGLMPEEALEFIPKIENYKNVYLEGIYTHFANSVDRDLSFAKTQLLVFRNFLKKLFDGRIKPPLLHTANSGATLRLPESYLDMVRPGIVTFGLAPSADFKSPFPLKPVMAIKSRIIQIRKIGKGETVGYGRAFRAKRDTTVATIPIGFGDGFRRSPVNWGYVLCHGKKEPLVGYVSMDLSSIDVTNIENPQVGDETVIIGSQKGQTIFLEDVAIRMGVKKSEITTLIPARVPRIYIE